MGIGEDGPKGEVRGGGWRKKVGWLVAGVHEKKGGRDITRELLRRRGKCLSV